MGAASAKEPSLEELAEHTQFSIEELEKLKGDFSEMEMRDGKPGLNFNEWRRMCGKLGVDFPDVQTARLVFSGFDENKDGVVDFKEFVTGASSYANASDEEKIKFLFDTFDLDKSGTISIKEAKTIFAYLSKHSTRTRDKQRIVQIADAFMAQDTDRSGGLDFEEFKALFE